MALIKKPSIEEAVAAADMVEVVSARTPLKRQGARWMGRCPFHEERTPSFSVNPAEKLFYCFGCGKGGDLIAFVCETEGLDFVQAVEAIADRYGVQLEYEEASPAVEAARRRRSRLQSLLEAAAVFYSRYLWETPAGEPVRAYLHERGLGDDVCKDFRLGLSPGGDLLARKAREKGYEVGELVAAGLVNRRGNDYFSQRLIFPLADFRGRVLGFGARRIAEDDPIPAKYVNSPESELFRKAWLLYGLDRARASIAKERRGIVVEGYTDVLALHQSGIESVVASMGTALTEQQLKDLRRLTGRIYLCFDADAAGADATLRGMDMAYRQFDEVLVVPLPPGSDPGSAPEGFEDRLANSEPYPRYRVKLEVERAHSKEDAFRRVQDVVGQFERNTEWLEAVRFAANQLDLPPDLQSELAPRGSRKTGTVSRRVLEAGEWLEKDALAGVIAHPRLASVLGELSPEHFDEVPHRRLQTYLTDEATEEPNDDLVPLIAELDARAASDGIDEATAKQLILRLRERHLRRRLASADPEEIRELQAALEEIRDAAMALA